MVNPTTSSNNFLGRRLTPLTDSEENNAINQLGDNGIPGNKPPCHTDKVRIIESDVKVPPTSPEMGSCIEATFNSSDRPDAVVTKDTIGELYEREENTVLKKIIENIPTKQRYSPLILKDSLSLALATATPATSQTTTPSDNITHCDDYSIGLASSPVINKLKVTNSEINDRDSKCQLRISGFGAKNNCMKHGINETLQDVIRREFDLEILLKHHELQIIEDEIAKIHVLMLRLKQYSLENTKSSILHIPSYCADFYARYLNRGQPDLNITENDHHMNDNNLARLVPNPTSTSFHPENEYQLPLTRSRSNISLPSSHSGLGAVDKEENLTFKRHVRQRMEKTCEPDSKNSAGIAKLQCIIRRNDGILVR